MTGHWRLARREPSKVVNSSPSTARLNPLYLGPKNGPGKPMILRLIASLAVIATLAAPAFAEDRAQDRRVPGSPAELRLSYAPVVQKAAPSVVNVYPAKVV